jgi:hypothetical protein
MAAPNLNNAANTVTSRIAPLALSATTETALLTNAASSNRLLRVRSVTINNVGTTGTVDVTVRFYDAASGGTAFAFPAITIPVGGSVIVVGNENSLPLEEDRRLTVQASAANFATVLCSYEEVTSA